MLLGSYYGIFNFVMYLTLKINGMIRIEPKVFNPRSGLYENPLTAINVPQVPSVGDYIRGNVEDYGHIFKVESVHYFDGGVEVNVKDMGRYNFYIANP
jgi:hypothetical protein